MALSNTEFVAEILSGSSTGGQFGVVPMLASALEAGSGVRLVEAWLARSPDRVRRILFLLGHSEHCYILKMTITEHVQIIPLRWRLGHVRFPFKPTQLGRPLLVSRLGFGMAHRPPSL
mgnify:CR=1 FL=1